jgi:hypothetical protein
MSVRTTLTGVGCHVALPAPVMRCGEMIFASFLTTADGYAISRDRVSTRLVARAVQDRRAVVAGISTESCGY